MDFLIWGIALIIILSFLSLICMIIFEVVEFYFFPKEE